MNFKEAYDHLKEGKKIRRREWDKSLYISLSNDGQIHSFREEFSPYNYNLSIITSNDWIINGEEKEISFSEMIEYLVKGKTARLNDWTKDSFIMCTRDGKEIFLRTIGECNFTPTFACFSSSDWEVIE